MMYRINSYFAILIITIAGAGASLIIIHVAYANTLAITLSSGATLYATGLY